MNLELLQQPINPELKRLIVKALRRYSLYWPARDQAFKKARVSRGRYQCNICKVDSFKKEECQADHIVPVVDIRTGNHTWYDLILFIINLYGPAENWQILCLPCHEIKTATENEMRTFYRQQNKPKKSRNRKKRRT